MPASTKALLEEKARQARTGDKNFLKRLLYYWELRLPAVRGFTPASYFFPMILPPQSLEMSEPFSAEITHTQGGGVHVEENGIIVRTIRIKGNTGFKPRTLLKTANTPFYALADKSFSRNLPKEIISAISGQRHFQYLQDAVFRTYGDLKKDPATAEGTQLIFHNPKDEEHWLVIPEKFDLTRDSGNPLLYTYNIEVTAVAKAEDAKKDFSEDRALLDRLKDAQRTVKQAIDLATGAVNDLTALANDIKTYVNNFNVIIDSVTNVLTSASDFVNGVTSIIEIPFATMESTIGLVDGGIELINANRELGESIENFPDSTLNKFRQLQDSLEQIAANPNTFETALDKTVEENRTIQESRRAISRDTINTALETPSPTSFNDVNALGTSITKGDAESIDGENPLGGTIFKFKSARYVRIAYGDTLSSLAAQHMGDARLWQYIAIINGLKAPFLTEQASAPIVKRLSTGSTTTGSATGSDESPFGNALGVGDWILIPTNINSAVNLPLAPVLGVRLEEPLDNQFLGTDARLDPIKNGIASNRTLYDIPINSNLGSNDVQIVEGIPNLTQALLMRLVTEKGSDILYKDVGLNRVVGVGFTDADQEGASFLVAETILQDARIAGVDNIAFKQNGDIFETELDANIRGYTDSRRLNVEL